MRRGDTVRLTVSDLDDTGAGVGHLATQEPMDDFAEIHVAGALPGEDVTARIDALSSHRPAAFASLLEVHAASPDRVTPACAAFGSCGGCVLQHFDYPAQLAWKEAALRRQIIAQPGLAAVRVAPTFASPRTLGYRNKSKLVAASADDGGIRLGAFSPRSHDVVDLLGCAIAEPPLDAVARSVAEAATRRGVSAYDERRAAGTLRYVILRSSAHAQVQVTLVTATRAFPQGGDMVADLRQRHPEIVGVLHNVNPSRGNVLFGAEEQTLWGARTLDDTIGSVRLRLSSRAFFQANRDVAAAAYEAIARATGVGPRDTVVDAYAGVGGIALTLADRGARRVIGIEEHADAVEDATANAAASGFSQVRFVAGDVAAHLEALGQADLVILNPPRKGCDRRVLEQAANLAPRTVAYLSCAPATLLRDLSILRELGYDSTSLEPFDMLPHTPHLEVLAVLNRRAR